MNTPSLKTIRNLQESCRKTEKKLRDARRLEFKPHAARILPDKCRQFCRGFWHAIDGQGHNPPVRASMLTMEEYSRGYKSGHRLLNKKRDSAERHELAHRCDAEGRKFKVRHLVYDYTIAPVRARKGEGQPLLDLKVAEMTEVQAKDAVCDLLDMIERIGNGMARASAELDKVCP